MVVGSSPTAPTIKLLWSFMERQTCELCEQGRRTMFSNMEGMANLRTFVSKETYNKAPVELYGTANLRAVRAFIFGILGRFFLAVFCALSLFYKFFTNSKIRFSRSTAYFSVVSPWKLLFTRMASSIGTNFKTNSASFSPSSRLCVPISFSVSHK